MCTQEHIGKWDASSRRHKKCLPRFLLSGLKWATRHRRANDAFVHTCCPWGMCKFTRKVVLKMEILPLNCREYGLVQSTVVNLRQRQARQIYLWGFEAGGAVLYKDWSLSAYSSWNFSPEKIPIYSLICLEFRNHLFYPQRRSRLHFSASRLFCWGCIM